MNPNHNGTSDVGKGAFSPVVLDFFPHNPYPPRTGAHHRCMQVIEALLGLGCKVVLCSSELFSEIPWDEKSRGALVEAGLSDVIVHKANREDTLLRGLVSRLHRKRERPIPLDSVYYTPPGLRHWFSRVVRQIEPDIVLINYAYWGPLAGKECDHRIKVIDYLDLLSINREMRRAVARHLPPAPFAPEDVDEALLAEDFFSALAFPELEEEMRILDGFDYTLCINDHEAALIEARASRTRTLPLPVTVKPAFLANTYTGPALFPTGPNPFNAQGYVYLARKVMPLVRQEIENPLVVVTGWCCEQVRPVRGIELAGFVDDMSDLYRDAAYLVCPVFGGTGQQIKIVEAMANGLPVVAMRKAAEATPLEHGVSGWVAEDAAGFAEGMVRLWRDRELCRRMGEAGRTKIAMHFSVERAKDSLSVLLSDPRVARNTSSRDEKGE